MEKATSLSNGDLIPSTILKERSGVVQVSKTNKANLAPHKFQQTINLKVFNTCLDINLIFQNMVLCGVVKSIEDQFYSIDFAFTDKSLGYMMIQNAEQKLKEKQARDGFNVGQLVFVIVDKIERKNKIIHVTHISQAQNVHKRTVVRIYA